MKERARGGASADGGGAEGGKAEGGGGCETESEVTPLTQWGPWVRASVDGETFRASDWNLQTATCSGGAQVFVSSS